MIQIVLGKGYTFLIQTHQFTKGKSSKILKLCQLFFSKSFFGEKKIIFFDGIFFKVHLLIEENHFKEISARFRQFKTLPESENENSDETCKLFLIRTVFLILDLRHAQIQ